MNMVKLSVTLWTLHRIYKVIVVLTTLIAFMCYMVPLVQASFERVAIMNSYINANMRVYDDSSRAGYIRSEIFFNSQTNRFNLRFHIGDGFGYYFNPILFILSFVLSTFILPIGAAIWSGYVLVQIYKWWIKKKVRPDLSYIRALHKIAE